MDDLTVVQPNLIGDSHSLPPGSKLLSPGLHKLLVEAEESGGACRLIALNKTLRAECERVLPILEDAKEPATRAQIVAIVVRNMLSLGVSAKDAALHKVTWDSYADALEGFSAYAIEDAFVRWNRGEGHKDIAMGSFPPKQPQVVMLAEAARRALFMAAYRARKALDHAEAKASEWTPERKAAERAKAIELGYLTPDGKAMPLPKTKGIPPMEARPRVSQHEMAAQLRAMAPKTDDVGDVI